MKVRSLSSRLVVSAADGFHVLPFREISNCTADGNYCRIFLKDGSELLVAKTLKYIESQLPSQIFIRVHQSHLVNRDYVRFFTTDFMVLTGEARIPISRSRRSEVFAQFQD